MSNYTYSKEPFEHRNDSNSWLVIRHSPFVGGRRNSILVGENLTEEAADKLINKLKEKENE